MESEYGQNMLYEILRVLLKILLKRTVSIGEACNNGNPNLCFRKYWLPLRWISILLTTEPVL